MSLPDQMIIIGAGGLAVELVQYLTKIHGSDVLDRVVGFLDDDPRRRRQNIPYGEVIGTISEHRVDPTIEYILAIGKPLVRKRTAELLGNRGARFATLIHPLASVYHQRVRKSWIFCSNRRPLYHY